MNALPGLEGKHAVVTGGSRGVGAATARLLARSGAHVAFGYRSRSKEAEALLGELESMGARALAARGDISQPETSRLLFDQAVAEFGGIDFFIGNAGVWPPRDTPLAEMSESRWRSTLRINLDSIFYSTKAALKAMRPGGRVVLVSSTAGQRGEAYHGDYAATKGAIISLVKSLCVEVAGRGITVNAVAPGWVDTEMSAEPLSSERREAIDQGIPLGRVAAAEDVAGPIVFLLTPFARHITGEVVNVNGGSVLAG